MQQHKALNTNDLHLLFAAGGADKRKMLAFDRQDDAPVVFKKVLDHKGTASLMKQHMDAVQRYVLDAGKGWGTFDRQELVATAYWWKQVANKPGMGLEIKNRISKAWGLLEELEQRRLAGGGLEGVEHAAWCKATKGLRMLGFRFVRERMEWQTNYEHVLQMAPPFVFRTAFPQAKTGEACPELYICRSPHGYEVVGVVPDAPKAINWESKKLVMDDEGYAVGGDAIGDDDTRLVHSDEFARAARSKRCTSGISN